MIKAQLDPRYMSSLLHDHEIKDLISYITRVLFSNAYLERHNSISLRYHYVIRGIKAISVL